MARAPTPATLRLASIWLWASCGVIGIWLALAHFAAGITREYGGSDEVPLLLTLAVANTPPFVGAVGLCRRRVWGWRLPHACASIGTVVGGLATVTTAVNLVYSAHPALPVVTGALTALCLTTARQLRGNRPATWAPPDRDGADE